MRLLRGTDWIFLYIILRSAHTLYLCVLCGSENKQRLFPYTALTGWFVRGLSKKFVQYVYKNVILQILGYINVVPFKILPIRHNTLVPPPFPLLEAHLEFLFF